MTASLASVFATLVFYASVAIWGTWGTCMLVWRVVRSPIKFLKGCTSNNEYATLPEIARDPALGTHDRVLLRNQGLTIKYVANGEEGKPLMLCVHGFPECWYSWRHQLKEFSNEYRVVAIDLPGYGDSDKPIGIQHYKIKVLVDILADIIKELGYEKATVVGHDWGGALVWRFAAVYGSMCDKVVVMNAPNSTGSKKGFSFKQYLCSWYMFFFQVPWIPEMFFGAFDFGFLDECFRGKDAGVKNRENLTKEDVDVYKYALHTWEARNCAINYYRANVAPRLLSSPDPKSPPTAITCPVLLIWGTEDGALTLPLAAKSASASESISLEYVDGASHWVQQDNPTEVIKLMRNFLT